MKARMMMTMLVASFSFKAMNYSPKSKFQRPCLGGVSTSTRLFAVISL